ncbi:ankyrin repeat domain-containing protein [Legionella sp. PC997]|uniref:ankyrin repeat domain-containing protein n=1 Tax=Legionella sp. PC997 TaxID=2755562 RepID=UPI001860E411|nr:ankyrin repeat domain-containing protein [Legionella sp. PC997]QMT60326.1 hypothetical protein HBNCFIEN_01698 [Legionella sp. PC997]
MLGCNKSSHQTLNQFCLNHRLHLCLNPHAGRPQILISLGWAGVKIYSMSIILYIRYNNFETMNELPVGQEWFIERAQSLGYKGNPNGMCFGLCQMATQAVLLGEYNLFKERLKQMAAILTENFPQEMEKVKEERRALFQNAKNQVKDELEERNTGSDFNPIDEHAINNLANEKFTKLMHALPLEDRARLTIDMFLDGVELYMQPHAHSILFQGQMKHQISDAAASLLLPPEIEEGVPSVPVFSGSYDTWDLYTYLGLLQQKLKDCKNPVSLRLVSENHAICLIYDPEKDEEYCWLLFNPNKMNNMDQPGGEETGDDIERGFCGELEIKSTIEFATWISFASYEDKEKFHAKTLSREDSENWMRMHNPKDLNSNWLKIALYNGDVDAVKKFLDIGFDIAEIHNYGLDYLETAIAYGHSDIVKLFLEKMAKTDLNPGSLTKAIGCGNLEIVKILLEAGVDPEQTDKSIGKSPLEFAKEINSAQSQNAVFQDIYETLQTKAGYVLQKSDTFKKQLVSIKEAEVMKESPSMGGKQN